MSSTVRLNERAQGGVIQRTGNHNVRSAGGLSRTGELLRPLPDQWCALGGRAVLDAHLQPRGEPSNAPSPMTATAVLYFGQELRSGGVPDYGTDSIWAAVNEAVTRGNQIGRRRGG